MKRLPRVISLVAVIGLMVAIPASTQIISTSQESPAESVRLPLLLLVNRLELSEEQMTTLHTLFEGLLSEQESITAQRTQFENTMIEFRGTSEELDTLVATYQEEQRAAAAALQTSLFQAMDQVRDLLSVNQGLILRDALPGLFLTGVYPDAEEEDGQPGIRQGRGDCAACQSTATPELRQRMGGNPADEGFSASTWALRMRGMAQRIASGLRERRQGADQVGADTTVPLMTPMGRGMMRTQAGKALVCQPGVRAGWFSLLEQLDTILELKLEAFK